MNQELNFSSPDNNLIIKGGCELFTTKPIGSDKKLFKTIDKHLNQIIEDNQLSRSLERERQNSIGSIFGGGGSPTDKRFNYHYPHHHHIQPQEQKQEQKQEENPGERPEQAPEVKQTLNNLPLPQESKRRSSSQLGKFKVEVKVDLPKASGPSLTTTAPTISTVDTINKTTATMNETENAASSLPKSFNDDSFIGSEQQDPIDESPFGPLKSISTRKTFSYLIAILNNTFPDQDFSSLQPTTENFYKLDTPEDLVQKFNNLLISLGKKEDILNWIWDIINSYMDVIPSKTSSPLLAATSGALESHSYGYNQNGSGSGSGSGYGHSHNHGNEQRQGGTSSRKNSFLSKRRNSSFSTLIGGHSPLLSAQQPVEKNCQIYQFQPSDESIFEDLTYPYQPMWSYYWFIYNKRKKRVTFLHLTAINKVHYSNVNEETRRKRLKTDRVIRGDGYDDEEEYDENDEYRGDSEEFVASQLNAEEENTDIVGDLEI